MARILVAEDEPDIRHLIALTLEFNGFDVVSVNDGFEAIEAAKVGGFDLIVLDVRMPRTSGYDACRQLRKFAVTKNTPIVFLSAKGQESEVETGLDAGADEYILKPFAPNDLVERINYYLAKSKK
ncbi:MAG TPA: response regulator [Patescibacteria group bacterium]|nr:response regulator [Patescibacteria group bacterium]